MAIVWPEESFQLVSRLQRLPRTACAIACWCICRAFYGWVLSNLKADTTVTWGVLLLSRNFVL